MTPLLFAHPWYLVTLLSIGKQVLIAFATTSAVALCLSFAHTVVTLHDHNGGYWIDVKLGNLFESYLNKDMTNKRRREVKAVLETVVLNLSDQQALVGIAMLLAGSIRICSISVYHFTIVSDLGWFAANTHLITMGVLQLHFRSHQVQRNWRVMLILMFFALMLAVSVLSAHQAWFDSYSSHAKCLFDDLIGNVRGEPALWMGINVFLLLISYPSAMISLFEDLNSSYEQWLYIKPQKFLERQMKNIRSKYRALRYLKTIPWGIPWCLHRILVVYDDSPVIAWLFNIGWFIYGLQSGLEDRWPSPAGENEMGFGQLVPIFLLISTVFVVREAWDGKFPFERPCITHDELRQAHRRG